MRVTPQVCTRETAPCSKDGLAYGRTVRQLLPEPAEVDPYEVHAAAPRPAPAERPWVMLNVIVSVDGSTSVDGVSGPLGSPADKQVFSALRSCADVVLAGAGTVTAESYRPPRTRPDLQELRLARGQRAKPRIAVVSASLSVAPDAELFSDPSERPIVITTEDADPDRAAALEEVADLVRAGRAGRIDLGAALRTLRTEGPVLLCEGGSTLNGHLVADDLVDEVNVSTAASLAAGTGPRLAAGSTEVLRPMALAHLWEADGMLLARYLTQRDGTTSR